MIATFSSSTMIKSGWCEHCKEPAGEVGQLQGSVHVHYGVHFAGKHALTHSPLPERNFEIRKERRDVIKEPSRLKLIIL
jgi:hypothetical protein